ncbi:reverse transcriptase (rna-dependent dna polymerase) [Holotrichia oblita]|uniref:Reverse transcriptase (Rna-dependent dna polymerase) n=1 Tax=Holotrichia oblita TaxID=644536 RepID=A0ACB9SHP6_HOLOL|nr:reverse transcriptase (rna-dependent dna polymerase) [Holotrichia oblita]
MHDRKITVGHSNIRSLIPKLGQISDLVRRKDYDIFGISETWLSNNISDHTLNIQGYRIFRSQVNGVMLMHCCPEILPYLTHVINECLLQNTFPNAWKTGVVTPIPKNSNPQDYTDMLPVMSKLLEKIMNHQLGNYVIENGIIPDSQSGFRPGHSCTTALSNITDDLMRSLDKGLSSALILLDFSRAFDTVDHSLLIDICTFAGLSVSAKALIESYLLGREQCVRLNDSTSNYRKISRGVPQGSILSPLLFNIYTSYFHKFLETCNIHMYADDMQLYHSFNIRDFDSALSSVQRDLDTIVEMSTKHVLYTRHMLFNGLFKTGAYKHNTI